MQAVAEHMNEMQKIYDEFGNTFDEMSRDTRLIGGKLRPVRAWIVSIAYGDSLFDSYQKTIMIIPCNIIFT